MNKIVDIFIIGGGINGCGVAADAAGRGLSVTLVEQNDLASGTSSASTKLIHGGLRYLEYYEFMLVRKALKEREVLLKAAPHIIKPMRFLLPQKGLRAAWFIRLGLFIYDHLGGRKILPPTKPVSLNTGMFDGILDAGYQNAFEYSDCSVDDARLVILNAKVAQNNNAEILTRHKCVSATRVDDHWQIEIEDKATGERREVVAKTLINAAGPWVDKTLTNVLNMKNPPLVRLVKGSHIIVKKLYDHDRAYVFQGNKGRIIFAIPYQDDFTLIGTTDQDYVGDLSDVIIDQVEIDYLCKVANEFFKNDLSANDVVSHFAGVRPLYDDGASKAQEATRDFVLDLDKESALLNIIGGKITTYRVLAEQVLELLKVYFPNMRGNWTKDNSLPGGDFKISQYDECLSKLQKEYSFLDNALIKRFFDSYGTMTRDMLENVNELNDMGHHFGHGLFEKEIEYLIQNEWAKTVEDILWRRTKLGLYLNKDQQGALIHWLATRLE